MKIYIEKEHKTIEKEILKPITGIQLLEELHISKNSVLLVKNGEICLEDEELTNSDEIKILSVVSGG
jgi:sulfur carrier protein ThiS